jgi:hypothetical protein
MHSDPGCARADDASWPFMTPRESRPPYDVLRFWFMRLRLFIVLAATTAPLLAFAVFAVPVVSSRESENFLDAARARNRATLAAADAELTGAVGVLRALSGAASLRRGDLAAFHQDAKAVSRYATCLAKRLAPGRARRSIGECTTAMGCATAGRVE